MKKDETRLQTLRCLLKEKELGGLVLFHPENVLLGSGMPPAALFTVCMITQSGQVILISPWWRKEASESMSWADQILTFDWLKHLKNVDPVAAILSDLRNLRKKLGVRSVGYDGSFDCLMPFYSPSTNFTYSGIKNRLPDIFDRTIDVGEDIKQLRTIKTPYEIRMLQRANKVAMQAARTFYKQARPGVREIDLAADILRVVQREAGKGGIKFTYCDPPQITSGAKRTLSGNAFTCPATSRKLKEGDLVMLELGGCADGYWFDLTRTLVVNRKPKQIHKDMSISIKEAIKAAITAYLAGHQTGDELTKAAFDVLKKNGFEKGIVHGLGHGVGFAYHEQQPGIGPGSQDIIRPGMVTSVEPGIYLPGVGGIRIEENVVWMQNKVKILSSYHNELTGWSEAK